MDWSESTSPRTPLKGSDRWYETDADRAPLGVIPVEILSEVSAHWALALESEENLPESFNSLSANHFSGLPVVNTEIKDFFLKFCGSEVQVIPVEKLWSLADKARVHKKRFHVNVYGSFPTVDLARTASLEAVNPSFGQKRVITASPVDVYANQVDTGDVHVWRDEATSIWLCDDVFKEAMVEFRPNNYSFELLKL